jgi:peptidyl-prolyl cis-trans isomerase C
VCARLPLLLVLGLVACSAQKTAADRDWTPVVPPDLGAIVARVGEVPIFASQVLAEAKRTGRTPREALDDLVTFNLLAEQARQHGLRPAAMSDEEVRSALVQRLLERDLEPSMTAESIPDQVLRPIYDKAKHLFVHPRLVEVGVLAIYTGALMKDKPREERTRTAKELATWVQTHPPKSLEEFSAIGRAPAWTSRHVSYAKFFQGTDRPLSSAVAPAIAALKTDGEMTQLLSDDAGFYIARYVGERPPENITFEQARAKLRAGYQDRWKRQHFQEYTNKLKQAHKVVAFFERLNEQGP